MAFHNAQVDREQTEVDGELLLADWLDENDAEPAIDTSWLDDVSQARREDEAADARREAQ